MKYMETTYSRVLIAVLVIINYIPNALTANWKIVSTVPQNLQVHANAGESVRLSVTVSAYIRRCTWIQEESGKACEFKYVSAQNQLVKQSTCQLEDHEGRIHVAGNYEKHECGMRISDAMISDTGVWRVEVKEYLDKNPISIVFGRNPTIDNRRFTLNVTEKTTTTKKTTTTTKTTLAPLLQIENGSNSNTVIGSPRVDENKGDNEESTSSASTSLAIFGGICGLLALIAVVAFAGYRYRKLFLASRNESVRFSDVYPRDDDDDKTWRGDEAWRVKSDGNIYSEPPNNDNSRPCLDEEVQIGNPRNEKALEKMGESHVVSYTGSRRVL